jgi:hypothetical protein
VSDPNLLLRRARERLPSPSAPGETASRQDLADLVNAWILKERKRDADLTANYIGKLERGQVRWPNRDYREALRAICGVDHDSDLGFARSQRAKGVPGAADVDRKGFIRTALGVAAAVPLAELARPARAAELPAAMSAAWSVTRSPRSCATRYLCLSAPAVLRRCMTTCMPRWDG